MRPHVGVWMPISSPHVGPSGGLNLGNGFWGNTNETILYDMPCRHLVLALNVSSHAHTKLSSYTEKKVEPQWLHPGAVLKNSATLEGRTRGGVDYGPWLRLITAPMKQYCKIGWWYTLQTSSAGLKC